MVNQEKKRRSAEMFPIIEEWQTGKENKKAFCKQKGIAISVFYYWQKRYKESQDSGGFVPCILHNDFIIWCPKFGITQP